MYIKFCNFRPYADVKVPGKSKEEPTTDVYRRVHLFKRISAVFIILSLLLLAVVLALALKLYEVQSIQKYPERLEDEELNCSLQLCQSMYPSTQAAQNHGYQCSECGNGWLKFENSCYLLSNERQTWQKSREMCQKMGGDLVVMKNEHVQKFLTKNGRMLYWIGLRYSGNHQWMWVNNTALTRGYWANGEPKSDSGGFCALLRGWSSELNNWNANLCAMVSHYICQKD